MIALTPHPARDQLTAEAHSRPSADLALPVLVSCLVMHSGEEGGAADRAHLLQLCRKLGVPEPGEGARRHQIGAGGLTLVWERHTEFSSYTLIVAQNAEQPLSWRAALDSAPEEWLSGLPGELLVAVHLAVRPRSSDGAQTAVVRRAFGHGELLVSEVQGGEATLAADFRPDGEGFVRMLLFDADDSEQRRGRLVQKLLEMETYRIAALLGFAVARATGAELRQLEERVTEISEELAEPADVARDRDLLDQLSAAAGKAEALRTRTAYRYAATQAYWRIVEERIESLRERRSPGNPSIAGFMERRLAPAYRTCMAADARQNALTDQIARATRLLATRVDVKVSEQNAQLLASMDRRARLQLRLQETVEGLSIVAITYYGVGLIGYLATGLGELGLKLDKGLVTAAAIPLVALAVYQGVRRVRRRLAREEESNP